MSTNLEERARELWQEILKAHQIEHFDLHGFTCTCGEHFDGDGDEHQRLALLTQVQAEARLAALEEAAHFIESCDIEVVYRYTPFPHNKELTENSLAGLAEAIRALAQAAAPAKET